MGFTRSYVTKQGLALISRLVTDEQELKITRAMGGIGQYAGTDYSDMTGLENAVLPFAMNQGVAYLAPDRIQVPLYYENSAVTARILLTEIGLYAEEADGSEILLAIAPSYDEPLPIPSLSEGRLEMTTDFIVQLSLTPEVDITLPSSMVYLTRPEADGLYWQLSKNYPATKITESNGSTTEAHQRWQDEQLEQLKKLLESGSTAGTMVDRPVLDVSPYHWKILNHSGYRDSVTNSIRA